MGKKLDSNRLPKGTKQQLRLLLQRCLILESHSVYIARHQIVALQRVLGYLDANDVEGGKS